MSSPDTAVSAQRWECFFCGRVYDEAQGDPEHGIAPGTRFEDIPDDWTCPDCGAGKGDYYRA